AENNCYIRVESRLNGFEATIDFSRATEVDALILWVLTPLSQHREPDLSFVLDMMEPLLP
ncbi:MAG: UDP-N-acetyl-D-glucosamine dehydrogenase, partial [Methyloprofundus sp.]|nr:UDP-N-acetyl-D-glucosamine dehydrogenase [Methyloprofundus sp.]